MAQNITHNLKNIKKKLPDHVNLVAVSKTKPADAILEAYHSEQFDFGENKVQELVYKYETLPKDIRWHMIGHLQTNKVKYIASFVYLIHSVDSIRLLRAIDSEAEKNNRVINILFQLKIASEDTKFGLSKQQLIDLLELDEFKKFEHIKVLGLMGMATFTDEIHTIKSEFGYLKKTFEEIKSRYFNDDPEFSEISMGMSDDYLIAIEEGSTLVRVGSNIFGERNYV